MGKSFHTDGYCDPELHYMVDVSGRLREIKSMVDSGKFIFIVPRCVLFISFPSFQIE